MRCANCQHDNPDDFRFCMRCGTKLEHICPACGASLPPESLFCGKCGVRLPPDTSPPALAASATEHQRPPAAYTPPHLQEKILTSRSALEGERKQVTILFADLKGSMELLADRDPEDARQLLDPVLTRMMEAVHHYEGTVNQVLGDGIMALFGAPLAHEDHAVRACYAALRMQELVQQYAVEVQRTEGLPIQMRVGLNAGEVVVRSIGSDLHMDYTAVGQTVHLAARMEQMAMPGSILLTAEALRLAEGYVQVEPLGAVRVKGLSEPVGNPFFLEENMRTLVETGALIGERGAYRLAQDLTTMHMPPTVQAVLAARIDRLPPDEKRLLQTAAVLGKDVPFTLLQAIAEVPEATFRFGLAHLPAAEFLYETSLFPELEYTFKHALTHEVAYGGLLQERRRTLHARIVEAMEQRYAERLAEQLEQLAHHALRGEVWDKAVTYCQQAGARAHDRAAFHEALAAFEQALQALAHLPEDGDTGGLAIELRLALGGALRTLGEYGRHLALLSEAEALARALDDRARLGRVLAAMANALRLTGDSNGAIAAGQLALEHAAALGESALQVQASLCLGQVYANIGDFNRAAELLRRSVEAADRESSTPSTDVRIESRARLAQVASR